MILTIINPEYWITIWIVAELSILTFIIRRNMTKQVDPRKISALGLSIVVFGTFFYLVFGIGLFQMNEYDSICVNSVLSSDTLSQDIEDKLLGDKLWKCYNQTNDTKWSFFMFSVIMSMVIVFGSILQVLSNRNQ